MEQYIGKRLLMKSEPYLSMNAKNHEEQTRYYEIYIIDISPSRNYVKIKSEGYSIDQWVACCKLEPNIVEILSMENILNISKHLLQVKEFHDTFCPEHNNPKQISFPSEEILTLRLKLLNEELNELENSIEKGDMIGTIDGIADLQYVLDGTILALGLSEKMTKISDEVHRSNMSKLDEKGKVIRREDGKVLKSNLFSPPNFENILK